MSPLEDLPAEIFVHITDQVAANASLASFAATSRRCEDHVESVRFRHLIVKASTLPDFIRIVKGRRFSAIRALSFEIDTIEAGPGSDGAVRITPQQLQSDSEVFTDAISGLLTTLRENHASLASPHEHPGIELWLSCKTRHHERSIQNTMTDSFAYIAHDIEDGHCYEKAWIRLLQHRLPADITVPVITAFQNADMGDNYLYQRVWPASWAALFSRFPNLKTVHAEVFDDERKDLTGRIEARNAFAASLSTLPRGIRELSLTYHGAKPSNELLPPPQLESPSSLDIFSSSLAIFSKQLVKLELNLAVLNLADFFRTCAKNPCSNLQTLQLQWQQIASTDGSWYFDLDPRITLEEFEKNEMDPDAHTLDEMREWWNEDELPAAMDVPLISFRTAANPAKMKEVYLAAADAVKAMPELRLLELEFQVLGATSRFGYGEHVFRFVCGEDRRLKGESAEIKVVWEATPVFDVDAEVVQAWKNVGEVRGASIALCSGEGPSEYTRPKLLE